MRYDFITMKKLLFIFLLLLISYFLPPASVKAQSLDLQVSPPIFQIELTPPANINTEQELTVENTGNEPLVLDLMFRAFEPAAAENGTLTFLDATKPIPGANPRILERIEILEEGEPITRLRLAPSQVKKLGLRIRIPKDEPPSDYYLTLIFLSQRQNDPELETSNAITTGGVGVNLLLSVGPQSATSGILEEFSAPFFQETGPVPFTVRLKNTSSHFIYPEGIITIRNMFGQTIGQIELLPVNILSGSTRALPSTEQFEFLARKQEAERKLASGDEEEIDESLRDLLIDPEKPQAFWNEKFLLGPYTATLEIALSDEGPVIVRKIHFMGFPFYILIGIGVAITVIVFIKSRLKHRRG